MGAKDCMGQVAFAVRIKSITTSMFGTASGLALMLGMLCNPGVPSVTLGWLFFQGQSTFLVELGETAQILKRYPRIN